MSENNSNLSLSVPNIQGGKKSEAFIILSTHIVIWGIANAYLKTKHVIDALISLNVQYRLYLFLNMSKEDRMLCSLVLKYITLAMLANIWRKQ